jgi:hypothetical protein
MRALFEDAFGGPTCVELRDAHSLEVLPRGTETCASTRYVLMARKDHPIPAC